MARGAGRRIAFRAAAMAIALVVATALGEVAVRVFKPQVTAFTGKGLYAPDPDVGHVLRPHLDVDGVRTNSFGFRDREVSLEKPPGTYRIVALGDSFTFGAVNVEDGYPDVLEGLLAEAQLPVTPEVVNTGVPSYNTDQEIRHLRKFGIRFDPDLVILGFFIGGDIAENWRTQFFDVVDGELVNPHFARGPLERLLMRSHLFRLLCGLRPTEVHAAPDAARLFLETERDRMIAFASKNFPASEPAYAATERYFVALRDDTRSRNVDLLVLLIPDEIQVNPNLFREVCETFSLDGERFDLDLPYRRLGDFLAAQGIAFVDVLAECRERQKREPVYIPRNTHWNRVGNEIGARALAKVLLERVTKVHATSR